MYSYSYVHIYKHNMYWYMNTYGLWEDAYRQRNLRAGRLEHTQGDPVYMSHELNESSLHHKVKESHLNLNESSLSHKLNETSLHHKLKKSHLKLSNCVHESRTLCTWVTNSMSHICITNWMSLIWNCPTNDNWRLHKWRPIRCTWATNVLHWNGQCVLAIKYTYSREGHYPSKRMVLPGLFLPGLCAHRSKLRCVCFQCIESSSTHM